MIDFIRKGKNTKDATATANDIIYPKTAYVDNEKITGNIQLIEKILDVGSYQATSLSFTNTLVSFDIQTIQEYILVLQVFSDKTLKIQLIKNYTEILFEQTFNIAQIFTITNSRAVPQGCCISINSFENGIFDFTISIAVSANDYQHILFRKVKMSEENIEQYGHTVDYGLPEYGYRLYEWLDIIRDTEDPNVFYLNVPNRLNMRNTFAAAFVRLSWSDDGEGEIANFWINYNIAKFDDAKECLLFQTTGNGNYITYANRLFEIDKANNMLVNVLTQKVFLSHNMDYLIYNNGLYSIDPAQEIATAFNNKELLLDLTNLNIDSKVPVLFSENDDYMIITGTTKVYIYKKMNETYSVDASLNISNASNLLLSQDFNAYNFIIADKVSQFMYLYYCLTNTAVVSGIQYLNEKYIKPDSSNTPNQSQVLEDASYIGIDGNTVSGTMPNNGELNYTPSSSNQTIPAGYTSGGTVIGDTNLLSENIKSGVTIFGVNGSLQAGIDTSDADAIPLDIVAPRTAYVNGQKITGTLQGQDEFYPVGILGDADSIDLEIIDTTTVLAVNYIKSSERTLLNGNCKITAYIKQNLIAQAIGLTADKIKVGETVLGITGTYTGETTEVVEEE